MPGSKTGAIFLSESDLSLTGATNLFKQRVNALKSGQDMERKYVFVEVTNRTEHLLSEIQKFVVIKCNLNLIRCPLVEDVAATLIQLVNMNLKTPSKDVFSNLSSRNLPLDSSVLSLVKAFPGVGPAKAFALLEKFKSIRNIMTASHAELAIAVGDKAATSMRTNLK